MPSENCSVLPVYCSTPLANDTKSSSTATNEQRSITLTPAQLTGAVDTPDVDTATSNAPPTPEVTDNTLPSLIVLETDPANETKDDSGTMTILYITL